MSVMDKLKKNSKIKFTSVLNKSEFFTEKEVVTTSVPMINVALSGDMDGGLSSGLTVLAGPSKHFKTSFALLMASLGAQISWCNLGAPQPSLIKTQLHTNSRLVQPK